MKKIKIEIKWAIIFTIMVLVWMFMEKLTGLHSDHIDKHPIYTNFIFIPTIVIYVLALLDKRKNDYNGIMTYKQGFISGLTITLIVTILSPFFPIPKQYNPLSLPTHQVDLNSPTLHFLH